MAAVLGDPPVPLSLVVRWQCQSSMSVLIEEYTGDELLALDAAEFDSLVFRNEPIGFRAASAGILGRFQISPSTITSELAHIDGGGEGVMLTLAGFAKQLAHKRGVAAGDWLVHAVTRVNPNPKLKVILERRG